MKKEILKRLRMNNEKWEKVLDENPGFATRVWEVVHPHYNEETDRTTIKYRKYVNKHYMTTDEIASRQWTEKGDARPRLSDVGYFGSTVVDSSGTYEEWSRQSFQHLTNY